MPYFTVNATVSYSGWVTIQADTPEAALVEAHQLNARDFDTDPGTAEVEFNVTPEVEPA